MDCPQYISNSNIGVVVSFFCCKQCNAPRRGSRCSRRVMAQSTETSFIIDSYSPHVRLLFNQDAMFPIKDMQMITIFIGLLHFLLCGCPNFAFIEGDYFRFFFCNIFNGRRRSFYLFVFALTLRRGGRNLLMHSNAVRQTIWLLRFNEYCGGERFFFWIN